MNAEQLLQHFERISEAPDALPRLRRFILDLAVRGKLLEQDPREETAAELLKGITAEKARLVKAGKARKLEVDPVTNEEISFPVPSNWVWTRLGSIGDWGSGSTPSRGNSDLYGGGITWLKSGELNDNRALEGSEETVSKLAVEKGSFRINKTGDVLIAMYGATIGKVAILAESAVTNQAICGCTPFPGVFNQYLFFYLLSQRAQFHSASEGGAQPNISKVKIIWTTFPLPPLAEQHRIVAKVDELMALCDQLEAAKVEREQCRDSLLAASLQGLNQPAEEEETFREHARFTFNNLPRITTRAAHIKQLRQTILNLAVRGKLVEQEPSDEPATEILKRISVQLTKDHAFPIPSGWAWASVGTVANARLGKMLDKAKNKGVPRPYLRNVNVRWFDFNLSDLLEMRFEETELPEYELRDGDVLICEGGEPGRAAVWDERVTGVYFQKAIHRVRFKPFVDPVYFVYALRASADDGRLAEEFTGAGIKHFTGKGLKAYRFPLPPLAEQHRIVAKVDELMKLCDQLEVQITATEQDSRRFLESVLADALAPGIDLSTEAEVA
ncbi:restriction endonuclease subunit S [Cyanobium sp. BA5m-10]|uniref:restriction endonuclease subunit S n=1 Tax=Cyanobium sp. BA5m-10 TaxID=2823705 RepID=UPI0020CE1B08|nr:restriction endonuclease subunit S [Cyanobium sp. BA5m-10]MCP9904603.1 restriction endonuclease subunit S [Cyanobium sp. BA5m-10]